MTPEAQRITIAEACGWTDIVPGGWCGYTKNWNPLCQSSDERPGWFHGYVPDYLSDLNAMHEAENVLTPEQWATYHGHLADVTGFSYDDTLSTKEAETEWMHRVCHAAAAQRAEAFLRTLNLWTS